MSTLTKDQKIRLAQAIAHYILDMGGEYGAMAGDALFAAHSAVASIMFDVSLAAPRGDRRKIFEHAASFYSALAECDDIDLNRLARQ
jgi:hypothetical protein